MLELLREKEKRLYFLRGCTAAAAARHDERRENRWRPKRTVLNKYSTQQLRL